MPETAARRAARHALADAIDAQGPAWHNSALSLRGGAWGNVWTEIALLALERTTRQPLDTTDDD